MTPSHKRWTQAMLKLRPRGFAWPRGDDTVQAGIFRGLAGLFREFWAFAIGAVEQWQPSKTCSRLDDWERALGLPDPCLGYSTDNEDRRRAIIAKLSGISGLKYEDSSPGSLGWLEHAVFAATGIRVRLHVSTVASHGTRGIMFITPTEYRPDCNILHRMRAGDRTGSKLVTIEHIPGINTHLVKCRPMRAGDRAGNRLIVCNIPEVLCYLHQIAPARYALVLDLQKCPPNT